MLLHRWHVWAPLAVGVCLGSLLLVCGLVRTGAAQTTSLGDLTGPWQLLADDYLVSEKTGVDRTYHAFEKYGGNPVLRGDQPWEDNFVYTYGTVLPNETGNGYRMWYHAYDSAVGTYRDMYATSGDGIQWEKPNLGLVSYGGSTDNNLFMADADRCHLPQVIHTPWDAPDRQYKLVGYDYSTSGFRGATSPDGLHWTDVPGNPILPNYGDVGNFVWDANGGQYLATPKVMASVRGYTRRSVGVSMTDSFENWSPAQLVLTPDEIDDYWVTGGGQHTDFYGLSAFAYESGYLGFLWVFQITDGGNDGPIYPELVSSRDGIHWTRQEPDGDHRTPMLALGTPGSWDDGMIFTTNGPLVEGDTIKLYYGGIDDTHGYPHSPASAAIGLATLRKDGFASLDAGATTGAVTTKPLENMSGPLLVNADAGAGWMKVEVLDAAGQVIPGYALNDCTPISADGVSLAVAWGSRTELPQSDAPMRLRFIYSNASLYSFMAGEGVDLPAVPAVGTLNHSGVLYTFEGDAGTTVTDKLIADGVQDAGVFGEVTVVDDPAQAAHGNASARFADSPTVGTLLELPETSRLGKAFTLAAVVDETGENFSRLFSSYNGGPAGQDEMVFDMDPSGATPGVPGLRAIVHGTTVTRDAVFNDDQYHHLAMTYNDGKLRVYLDGVQLGDEAIVPGGAVELAYNLHFGEDYSPTPLTNEPFEGRADDILCYRRPLAPSQILALAQNGAEAFFSGPHGIHYTAETDVNSAADALDRDGRQTGIFHNGIRVDDDPSQARVGEGSFEFTSDPNLSTLELIDSSYLGDAFTLAAFINPTGGNHQRLFGVYDGAGPAAADEIVFDVNPDGTLFPGLRAVINAATITPDRPLSFSAGEYHHLAMTYDDGLVILYLDGVEVGQGEAGSGAVSLARNLLFGEDWGGSVNEQFVGHADEILLLFEALSPEAIAALAAADRLLGDANGDGRVDDHDASILGSHWLTSGANWSMGDFNKDGYVNDMDAAILAAHWHEGVGEESVPEPTAAVSLLLGLLTVAVLAARHRT